MKIATIIARSLLGLIFVVFGLNMFLHFIPTPPPAEGPAAWARAALKLLDSWPSKEDAIRALQDSPFDMNFAFRQLAQLHEFHQSP